jgi:hypothetical protein
VCFIQVQFLNIAVSPHFEMNISVILTNEIESRTINSCFSGHFTIFSFAIIKMCIFLDSGDQVHSLSVSVLSSNFASVSCYK